ncbi:MAG: GSCFA domain-containing protein [Crocinitomix sp.]|nr:GSCFA domain-containing protein [Crocinitomix sp.]
MKFRTEIEVHHQKGFFKHNDQILSIGSCFANNVAIELEKDGFIIDQNPMGILFNPISIMKNIRNSFLQNLNESLIVKRDDYFYHFDYPSQFYAESPELLCEKIKRIQENTTAQLKKSNRLILTLGTAWVYNWLKKDEIVANCHKIPAHEFKKELLDLNYLIKSYIQFFEELRAINPNLEIILTVSPVRHIKNGLHENNLSKSILLLLADHLVKQFDFVHYFPAYEIVLDDLRDYRFFGPDLIHPSPQAINYVYEKFAATYFDQTTQAIVYVQRKINSLQAHRPLGSNPKNEELKAAQIAELHRELNRLKIEG